MFKHSCPYTSSISVDISRYIQYYCCESNRCHHLWLDYDQVIHLHSIVIKKSQCVPHINGAEFSLIFFLCVPFKKWTNLIKTVHTLLRSSKLKWWKSKLISVPKRFSFYGIPFYLISGPTRLDSALSLHHFHSLCSRRSNCVCVCVYFAFNSISIDTLFYRCTFMSLSILLCKRYRSIR